MQILSDCYANKQAIAHYCANEEKLGRVSRSDRMNTLPAYWLSLGAAIKKALRNGRAFLEEDGVFG